MAGIIRPFKVMGIPWKPPLMFVMLYLANLNIPQNRKTVNAITAIGVCIKLNPKIAGATPNEIVSASESNSFPNSFTFLIPSSISNGLFIIIF